MTGEQNDFPETDEEFDMCMYKAMIKVAKKLIEYNGYFPKVLKHFMKEGEVFAVYAIGCLVGIYNTRIGSEFSYALENNFSYILRKIREGIDDEALLKEYDRVMKEYRRTDFMVYGG